MPNKVKRIETHKIKPNHKSYQTLVQLSHLSNNLYNQANFIVRQNFIYNNCYLNYYKLDKLFRRHDYLQDNWNQLPSQAKQQVIKLLDQNWKSFFRSIKDYKKNKFKYLGRPKLPKYRQSGDQFLLILTSQEFKHANDGYIYLAKKYDRLKIKTQITTEKINQIRIIPKYRHFQLEVIYEKDINSNACLDDDDKVASIDLGLNNLATLVTNFDTNPLIYNGKKLKSINHYYNYKILLAQKELNLKQNHIKLHDKIKRAKTALEMKSLYDNDIEQFNRLIEKNQNQRLNQYTSNKMKRLWLKRENKINNELHKISRLIIDYCLNHNIKTLVIGHNKNQKQKSKLKHFTQIPIFRLVQFIAYKAEEVEIKVFEVNEAYTSGTSFLDHELSTKAYYDKKRRVKRGLFKTNTGRFINSDVNAAYQIMRKYDKDLDIKYSNKLYNPIICDV